MPRILVLAAISIAVLPATAQAARVPAACKVLGANERLIPFPSDSLTVAAKTATKRRVNIPRACTPANKKGVRIDMAEQNKLDGFSPASQILLHPKGLNSLAALRRSGLAPNTDIGSSLKKNAPVAIIDAQTRKRVPYFAELDANEKKAANPLLIVQPARNLTFGRRYVVVVRGLKTANGKPIGPLPALGADRPSKKLAALLAFARKSKIRLDDAYAVFDFTVGSRTSIQNRLLKMRDDAFAQLGDTNLANNVVEGNAPAFVITEVKDFTPDENANLLRLVVGTMQVPCYLNTQGCAPGARLNLGADGLPAQRPGSTQTANFRCVIPRAATDAPGRGSLYGHGLLGKAEEAINGTSIHFMAQEHNFTFCATDWSGFADEDIPNTIGVLNDLSKFEDVPARTLQGMVDFTYLGRLMRHPLGLTSNAAFQVNGHPAFDSSALFYDGNSQGGILGSTLTAIAPDFQRAVLGVPGTNFSLLLTRSSNWKLYGAIFNPAYPEEASRPLALQLIEMLWDRAEPSGWVANMTTSPPPNTPAHTVLMHVARGDWQVTPLAAEIMARTNGARTNATPFAPGVSDDKQPAYGIPRIPSYPFAGSALIYWEPGGGLARVPKQPLTNIPEHTGVDPHGDPRYTAAGRAQKAAFLAPNGAVTDVCGGGFCQAEKDPARP
jgi:hypothetical protein